MVEGVEEPLGAGVDEDPADLGERVVTGGAGHRPVRQLLAGLEDLLDGQPGVRRGRPQPFQITARVPQAVRVVHPDALDRALVVPAKDLPVCRLEDLGVLDPQAGQVDDGEEPAVVQLGVATGPVDQLVVLPVVHLAGGAPAGALGDRIPLVVVAQLVAVDLELVQRIGLVGQHRQQQPAPGPVDVVELRVRRLRAVLEHIPPRRVGRGDADAGVVGHDVDDQPQAGAVQGRLQREPALLPAHGRVDLAVVDDVVAVLGVLRRGQQRGRVEVADPEVGQVVGECGRVPQREVGTDLDAIGTRRAAFSPVRGGGGVVG
jgi:hypothetical protein